MKTKLFILLLLIPINAGLLSQTFEEHYRQRQKEFDKYLNLTEAEYKEFIKEQDKEFFEQLKKNWDTFQMMQGKMPVSGPKPDKIPVFVDSLKKEFKIIEFTGPPEDTTSYKPFMDEIKPTGSFSFYKK